MMKKLLAAVTAAGMLVLLTACGVKKPDGLPVEPADTGLPEHVTLEQGGAWPETAYTVNVPEPAGRILWTMTDEDRDTWGVTLSGLSKQDVKSYLKQLEAAGFRKVKKTEKPLTEAGYVSLGTLYSDGVRSLSLSYGDFMLMLTISMGADFSPVTGLLKPSHITNVYQHSYATYDENDGIGIVTELYVGERETVQPKFTRFLGVAVVTLGQQQTCVCFGGVPENPRFIGSLLKTGISGQSGEKGTVTVSGIAYADNALGGGGSFLVTYPITIP